MHRAFLPQSNDLLQPLVLNTDVMLKLKEHSTCAFVRDYLFALGSINGLLGQNN